MNGRRLGMIVLAVAVYVVLAFGVLDGLLHWWAFVFSPMPDSIAMSLCFLVTVGYGGLAWRVVTTP
jgi:hypothetical protein